MLYLKRVLTFLIFCGGLIGLLIGASILLMPKNNMSEFGIEEVSANGILGEKENTIDVLVVGDSEAYSSISPMQIWKDSGYTSYVCGSGAQTLDYSLTLLKRAFQKQSPKLVILETDAIYREVSDSTADLSRLGDAFSVFRYHNRWKSLSLNDLKMNPEYTWTEDNKGYIYTDTIDGCQDNGHMTVTESSAKIPDRNVEYVKKFKNYCEAHGATLLLLSTPSTVNWNYERHNGVVALASELSCDYIDMNLMSDEISIDWQKDTKDQGDHLNYYGAQKVTSCLTDYLSQTGLFTDHREDSTYEKWNEALSRYESTVSATDA